MATKTVLQYVQATLNVMDSDNVDDISDTLESLQIANHLENVYYELLERQDWSFLHQAINITAAADTSSPTKFSIDSSTRSIDWLRYNTATDGTEYDPRNLRYIEPEEFVLRLSGGIDSDSHTLVTVGSSIRFYVSNDRMPEFWTSFDDENIFMDAYDSDLESTLTTARIDGWGVVIPTFQVDNTHTPDIPEHMVQLLQSELNRQSFKHFKQQESTTDEQKARRQLAQQRRRESKVSRPTEQYYTRDYGRKRGTGRRVLGRTS